MATLMRSVKRASQFSSYMILLSRCCSSMNTGCVHKPASLQEDRYALGYKSEELRRLETQHAVWRDEMLSVFTLAGGLDVHMKGCSLLDVGCGPGMTTVELAKWALEKNTRSDVQVVGIDINEESCSLVSSTAATHNVHDVVEPLCLDICSACAPDRLLGAFDGAYARWSLCWMQDPEAAISQCAKMLKPGATLLIQDYFDCGVWRLEPSTPLTRRVLAGAKAYWYSTGGDPDVGQKLPKFIVKAGLTITGLSYLPSSIVQVTSDRFQWPTDFFTNYIPTLIENGAISATDGRAFLQYLQELPTICDAAAAYYCPPLMVQVAAQK